MVVIQTRTAFTTAKDNYLQLKKNLELAEKIYDRVRTKYNEGVGSSIELAQAESSLTESQSNYLSAIQSLLQSKVELDKALGNF